jgi:hypothetical protein
LDWDNLAQTIKGFIDEKGKCKMARKFIHETWEQDKDKSSMDKFDEFCQQHGIRWKLNKHGTYFLRHTR